MAFFQEPPALGNTFTNDDALRAYLARVLPDEMRRAVEPELEAMGALAVGKLGELARAHRGEEPTLVQWDAWGQRVDTITPTPLWKEAARVAATHGVVATAYERKHGALSRVHQFALAYLFEPSTEVYSCPLAMTDGAARTLVLHGGPELVQRAVTRLTSRDPDRAWTSGQWMTERTGGSDVAISETVARPDTGAGASSTGWRLFGTKWFSSATTAQMALTLARPEGNPPGGSGLALFYVEMRDEAGRLRGVTVNRLKDKLGTRMVPTAELTLDGAQAIPVAGLTDGIKKITPMLTVTRTWNAVCAAAGMRRGLMLARDYANKRVAFGAPLAKKPLHVDTLAVLEAEARGALLLAFRAAELLGRDEAGELTEDEAQLARLLTPIAKLTTAKQAVAVASEVLEAFGGAGYVEDTGLPRLLRDAQVLPIWEGTTNVLSLDVLRALAKGGSLDAVDREVRKRTERAREAGCEGVARAAIDAVSHARTWAVRSLDQGPQALEAGARRFALTLGRAIEAALLVDQAVWSASKGDPRPAAAARLFARQGIDRVQDDDPREDAATLLG
jgi:acyl-CoA dehydrogenase